MEIKTLFSHPWVSVKETNGWAFSHFTKSGSNTIGVLPYRMAINKGTLEFGVIEERIPCHSFGGHYLITGATENEGPSATAVMELEEEAGILAGEYELWHIGKYYPLKHSDCFISIFIVDVTGKELHKPKGDGSKHEREAMFKFVSGLDVRLSSDPNLITAYTQLLEFIK